MEVFEKSGADGWKKARVVNGKAHGVSCVTKGTGRLADRCAAINEGLLDFLDPIFILIF